MPLEAYLGTLLGQLREADLYRDPADAQARREVSQQAASLGVSFIDASSNDYLGLAEACVSRETLDRISEQPVGAGASRLVQGTAEAHMALEAALASWVNAQSALLFSSGFGANAGTIAALAGSDTVLISDALNHASLVDGCRLAPATVRIVPHLDVRAVEAELERSASARFRWVVTESYFSMDGDSPDLKALRALCDRHDAGLVVDEAHALGVFGPGGSGLCAENKVHADVLIGTLGKALGAQGAFVAGSPALRAFLWNRARTFVFSTAPSPLLTTLVCEQLRLTREAELARRRLRENCSAFRAQLAGAGLFVPAGSHGPIVPIVLGDNRRALKVAATLRAKGILAQPIRPPTVPQGSARIRVTIKATFSPDEIQRLADAIVSACADS